MKITRITDKKVSLRRTIDTGTEQQRKDVQDIIATVRNDGDKALFAYTKKFDQVSLSSLLVTDEEFTEAYRELDKELVDIIREAAANIRSFHEKQKRESWFSYDDDGTMLGQKMTPLDAVGVYVPGGTAAYPSSVLMNVIPAQVAGVKRIVITSPPNGKGTLPAGVLVAAKELGVAEIYKVGGAQAIAALAYGTETIASVDKIMGPGNIYVALAKREVFGIVDIDMIAGPSEIVVLSDETARANEIAADLLSQAEHDKNSSSILVTTSMDQAEKVKAEVEKQVALLPREEIAKASVEAYGHIYVTDDLETAIAVVNELAPEHLEVITENPLACLPGIKHAGAIFLGRYSSEPIGDYFAGPNHVLPTNGTARFSSPLNVDDFMKKSSIIQYSKQSFEKNFAKVAKLARLEGLEAHARAVEERLK
ncbi:histidinol dehydrogenase [Metabacillus niabensis]|uniref:Histidinol dehydrogenase n=1 Tax=Metabacillus niabensis TaxID=324854 RepID=A0ABT9YZV5_9BACI|nr:histidinol dehydrogenase [Metabacillus niabensis]MDQ0225315.1 histidinol dehydrogenase [Metabacillus niabensis]